jgi:integrase
VKTPSQTTEETESKASKKSPVDVVKYRDMNIPIYRGSSGGYENFIFSYYQAGKRIQKRFADLEKAKDEARSAIRQLSEGTGHISALSPQETADYNAAVGLLRQHPDTSLIEAVAEWSKAKQALGNADALMDAVSLYIRERSKTKTTEIKVGDLVQKFVDAKSREGLSIYYVNDIERKLKRFASAFRCHISSIQAEDIQQWISKLPGGQRTANNIRCSVATLFSFARENGFLPKDQKHAAEQVKKTKEKPAKIGIYTPEEIERILTTAQKRFIPAIAIAAFAGLRSAEIFRLDWRDIKIERGHIVVAPEKAKTATRRLAPLTSSLKLWLADHAKAEGRVTPDYHNLDNLTRAFTAAAIAAKVKPQRNGFRHSFASYRLATQKSADAVALEMGNSPRKLFTNYRELVTEDEGKAWFEITPDASSEKVVSFAA